MILLFFVGELGTGKTKFTEGVLSYFDLDKEISSPTFTIVNEHYSSLHNMSIYHFDVYRLDNVDEFYAIGGEEYLSKGICIIEWGEIIEQALPNDFLKIKFDNLSESDNDSRILNFEPVGTRWEAKVENFRN